MKKIFLEASLMIKKNKTLLLLSCAIIFILALVGNNVVEKNTAVRQVSHIKELITEEKYQEAIDEYNSLQNKSLEKHINVVKEYLSIFDIEKIQDMQGKVLNIKETYKDVLEEDCFVALVKSLNEFESTFKSELDDIRDKTELFNINLESDIDTAEKILKELKKLYAKEDFSELDKVLEIAKAEQRDLALSDKQEKEEKEEKDKVDEQEQEKQEEVDEEKEPTTPGNNVSTIADTYAAEISGQIITVVSTGGAEAELCRWEEDANGNWILLDTTFAYLGSGGMKYGSTVYNWDMCTPTGSYSLTEAFGNYGNPGTAIPYRELDGLEHWVDDESSEYYNTMQFGDAAGRWNSSEHLSSFGPAYNYSIVIDYNRWPVSPSGSSAIFLHVSTGKPTWGCVSIEESKMIETLNWLDPSKSPRILLGFSYEQIYATY